MQVLAREMLVPFYTPLVWRGRDSDPRPPAPKADALSTHRVGGNQKHYQLSTNAGQKSIETVFSIAICRQCGVKWQSKTMFLTIFDLCPSIVLAVSIAAFADALSTGESEVKMLK